MADAMVRQSSLHEVLPAGSGSRSRIRSLLHPRVSHGGPDSRGKRKTARPFEKKAPVHVVLSSRRAKGVWSLEHRRNRSRISGMIHTYANRFKVKVLQARIEGGRIHLLIRARDRKAFADFFRVLAGRVAVVVSGAKRNVKKVGKFWDELCWSRLVNWGREFHHAMGLVREGEAAVARIQNSPKISPNGAKGPNGANGPGPDSS
jgi:REP element-mobilizing transposase RayT